MAVGSPRPMAAPRTRRRARRFGATAAAAMLVAAAGAARGARAQAQYESGGHTHDWSDINGNLGGSGGSGTATSLSELSVSQEGGAGSGVLATCGVCIFFADGDGALRRDPSSPTDCGFAGVPLIPPCGVLDLHGGEGSIQSLSPGVFSGMTALQVVDLGSHPVPSLPMQLFEDLVALRQLEFHFFALTSLAADTFNRTTALEFLGLRENSFMTLPDAVFGGLTALTYLSLRANGMSSIPEGLFAGLSSLSELDLVSNTFQELPAGVFEGLEFLRVLRLPNNNINALPPELLSPLSGLTWLDVRSCNVNGLAPATFDGVPQLRVLELSNNPLGPTLPGTLFANATRLEALYMAGAGLHHLPSTILLPLNELVVLDLNNNDDDFCVPQLPEGFPESQDQVAQFELFSGIYPHDPHEGHLEYAWAGELGAPLCVSEAEGDGAPPPPPPLPSGGASEAEAAKDPSAGTYQCACSCSGVGASTGDTLLGMYTTGKLSGLSCFCAEACLTLCVDLGLELVGLECATFPAIAPPEDEPVCGGHGWVMGEGAAAHCMCEDGYGYPSVDQPLSCAEGGEYGMGDAAGDGG
uniref:Uncharacterized protein n=1 Tax=Prasinoderma singulare TaxID=676789 RepID=A0A7S3BK81_9VIRI|mmetsp:Transcript_1907/g.5476  ORF Transcript_1907/g.5476 Transcript_1907/m.5476 type:complete len:582 (+) Transcript_1907:317-2062(+)